MREKDDHGGSGTDSGPLFDTEKGKGRAFFKLYAGSVFVGVISIWVYRALHIFNGEVGNGSRWVWVGMFAAELWFGFYWILTLSVRWNPVYRRTFKERLSQRYEDKLASVDVYVCTADPKIEPPNMVINTVLSVMVYDYPLKKLSVYLSDDGGSEFTFYALWEASRFAKMWIPFCKKFKVGTRSPAVYFSEASKESCIVDEQWRLVQRSYREMENRIDNVVKLGTISDDIRNQHKGFSEWTPTMSSHDHQAIVQILIDGREPDAISMDGSMLPTLVYVAREKRPHHFHNFKAGAMNTLLRVSSEISNGQIILNVDCDMFSNNSESLRDALCFFMDEEKGHEIGYVQFPQHYNNITKNDLYGSGMQIILEVDFHGLDGYGGPLYVGTGCFHRRHSLLGNKYTSFKQEWTGETLRNMADNKFTLEEKAKLVSTCNYEQDTQWGKEMGLKYGCSVEDVITGLSIQCRGWKSIYYNPSVKGFLGVAPMTLGQMLVQHKRWSQGDFQIFLSKYCPFIYGYGSIKFGLMMGYTIYCLWAPNSLPVLFYVVAPSLCLINSIPLFPNIYNPWFLPFVYVILTSSIYNLIEELRNGMTLKGWWNGRRIWMFKRITSYLLAFIDTILKSIRLNNTTFVITSKVADGDVSKRYQLEKMEFGASSSHMFTIISSVAMINFASLLIGSTRVALGTKNEGDGIEAWLLQLLLCMVLVFINLPVYEGMFFRKDGGRVPKSVTLRSVAIGFGVCLGSIAVAMGQW